MDKFGAYSFKARVLFVIYAIVCLVLFATLRFPYNVFKPRIENALSQMIHSDVTVGSITGHFPLGLAFDDLRIDGASVAPRLTIRPALGSLLLGRMGIVFGIEQAQGYMRGHVKTSFKHPGDPLDLALKLKEFDIAPLKKLMPGGYEIAGTVTGSCELETERERFKDSQGTLDLVVKDGQIPISIPSMPLAAVPFANLTLKADLEKGRCDIKQASLSGNDISGTLAGGIQLGMNPATTELNITGNLKLSQAYRAMLGSAMGDTLRFHLQGPLLRPQFAMR
jgi:type II secretion system protein N